MYNLFTFNKKFGRWQEIARRMDLMYINVTYLVNSFIHILLLTVIEKLLLVLLLQNKLQKILQIDKLDVYLQCF